MTSHAEPLSPCGYPLAWADLYRKDYDLATPESTAHPAKASWDLAFHILNHLRELGLLKDGDTVLDPMCGTSRFPIAACAQGLKAIGIELEARFVAFSEANRDYASRKLGWPLDLTIIQGDARRLGELLKERGLVSITSPPFADSLFPGVATSEQRQARLKEAKAVGKRMMDIPPSMEGRSSYGSTPGQIGALPDRPLVTVTSPPYLGNTVHETTGLHLENFADPQRVGQSSQITKGGYGETQGQIGQERNESYLEAMRQVYAQIALCSDVLVVVTKNPTRNGKLRDLAGDTERLLLETGWVIRCHHHAVLFEEQATQNLFGETKKRVKGRMSFFKRLQWQKGKSEIAQWEDVIFAVRGGGQGGLRTVMSPPYISGGHHNDIMRSWGGKAQGAEPQYKEGYGDTPGQIGNLKDA